jgi:hypothetical protein
MRSHQRNVTHDTNPSQAQTFNDLLKIPVLAATYRPCQQPAGKAPRGLTMIINFGS